MGARLDQSVALPKFVSYYTNYVGRKYFFEPGKHTTNLASISLSQVSELQVPTPSLSTQQRLVAALDDVMSVHDYVVRSIDGAFAHADRLHQSMLSAALKGKLVSHDPNDEPASVLLKRIRASRAEYTASKAMRYPERKKAKV